MKQHFPLIITGSKVNQSNQKLQQILEHTPDPITEQILSLQNQETDVKYQNITYCMTNRSKTVYYTDCAQIDFVKALSEINNLDWSYIKNGISFINLKNDENIFGHRIEQNKWHVLCPIMENGVYTGYQRSTCTNHESFIHMVRLFFEEVPWIEIQSWNTIKWEDDF